MSEFRWTAIDTAAIMFSSLSTKEWGRTFGYSAYFNRDIEPDKLREACLDLMPYYPTIYAYLKKGFFWNYLALSDKLPEIREADERGMLPIVVRNDGRPDFRLTYKDNRISIECSHSLSDGKGLIVYFKALLTRYNELTKGKGGSYVTDEAPAKNVTDAFSDYYNGGEKAEDSSEKAFHFPEEYEEDYLKLIFAEMSTSKVKELAHKNNMTITEYLSAVLMLGLLRSQSEAPDKPLVIAVPVNLRRFFPTMSVRNFTVQTYIKFDHRGKESITLKDILEETRGQLRAQIETGELQKTINKYGHLVNNPVIRVVPNVIKQPVMRAIQKKTHAASTTIFTNYGACSLPESLAGDIVKLQFINGDTRRYGLPVTCSCIGFNDVLSLCFSRTNRDTSWYDACVYVLHEEGIAVKTQVVEGKGKNTPSQENFREGISKEKIKAYFNI